MFCPSCGKQNPDGSKFCESCGATMSSQNSAPPPPQQSYNSAPPPPQQNYSPPQQNSYTAPGFPAPGRPQGPSGQSGLDAPLTMGNYIVMMLLSSITCGIALLVWAFGGNVNTNKKNYARAVLLMGLIGGALAILFSVIAGGLIASIFGGGGYYNGW